MLKRLMPSLLIAGLIIGVAPARAEMLAKPDGFPERPLTMVVPYGAGGG